MKNSYQTDVPFLLYVTIKTTSKCRFYVTRKTSSKRHSLTFIYYSHSKTNEHFLNFHFFYSQNSTQRIFHLPLHCIRRTLPNALFLNFLIYTQRKRLSTPMFFEMTNETISVIRLRTKYTVSNATFGDEDGHSPGTEIRSGENEVSWYNSANFSSSVIR